MDKIVTDNPFSEAQSDTLMALVRMMIPASTKYAVPGADDPEILADIITTARQHWDVIAAGLSDVASRADAAHDVSFAALAAADAMAVVEAVQEAEPGFIRAIVSITVQCYYRDPRVMTSLGMEVRPPYPEGFELPQGDWSMLDAVRQRGKVWRDAK